MNTALSAAETREMIAQGATVLDFRPVAAFVEGLVPRSIFLSGAEATDWLQLLDEEVDRVVLLTAPGEEAQWFQRIRQSGAVEVLGVLDAAAALEGKRDVLIAISAEEMAIDYRFDEFYLIDVREEAEYEEAHLADAENLPLSEISGALPDLDPNMNIYLYAETPAAACFAASLFKRDGFHKVRICIEGFEGLAAAGIEVVKKKKKA
ncbi:MAG: rhodanese-like domain-containing protein [Chitinophagales bacterium]